MVLLVIARKEFLNKKMHVRKITVRQPAQVNKHARGAVKGKQEENKQTR
jgi:hypothetical protein